MKTESASEFKNYLSEIIEGNDPGVLGKRAILNNGPSKQLEVISGILKLPEDEEIVIFFDDTNAGSGKGGLVLTSWGVRYKNDLELKRWALSWEELAEKYSFHIEGFPFKKLKLRNGQGNLFTVEKEINLITASFDLQWLKRILSNGCRIFAGKEPGEEQAAAAATSASEIPEEEMETAEEPEAPPPSAAEAAQKEKFSRQQRREYDKGREQAAQNGTAVPNIISENKGALILAVVLVILGDISTAKELEFGSAVGYCFLSLLGLPLGFFGCIIGNKLRLALHPDYIIASGFMGLLKERFFWRFMPQFIGGVLGWGIGCLPAYFIFVGYNG